MSSATRVHTQTSRCKVQDPSTTQVVALTEVECSYAKLLMLLRPILPEFRLDWSYPKVASPSHPRLRRSCVAA